MVKEVTGYKFSSKNAALGAQAQLRVELLGTPNPNNVTSEWVEVLHNTGSEGDFYYFSNDKYIGNILNPHKLETFTVNVGDI